ncbi:hypothetical protein [Lentzea sp. NPDC004782]|uniref:hypothetical protein n=1 Tax=Lentzea sp. NPDC004782 TaxID=3154458 RepID=UPI0033AF66DB
MILRSPNTFTRFFALIASLAMAGLLAFSAPASAAEDVTVTLRITLTSGDAAFTNIDNQNTCYTGFVPGQPKDVPVTVAKGKHINVWASRGNCYGAFRYGGAKAEYDGQLIELTI